MIYQRYQVPGCSAADYNNSKTVKLCSRLSTARGYTQYHAHKNTQKQKPHVTLLLTYDQLIFNRHREVVNAKFHQVKCAVQRKKLSDHHEIFSVNRRKE